MPPRAVSLSARSRCLLRTPYQPHGKCFSTQPALLSAGSHDHFDPPTGWLFGVKPGHKYVKEGWEGLFYYGFAGSLILATIAYAFKPDTSIQTWALEEARRRLEKEGILEDPDKLQKD